MITLENVDEVIARTGVSYQEAKDALEETNGDVLEAIIKLESKNNNASNKGSSHKDEFINRLKEIIKKGNVTKICVKKDGNELINVPMNAGVVGAVFFSPAIITGIIAALATGCTLEIVKLDGEIVSINEMTEETLNTLKSKIDLKKDDENK